MNSVKIGAIIQKERKSQGLRQQELASIADISVKTLSEIENGKANARIGLVLQALDALGIELKLIRSNGEPATHLNSPS